MRNIFIYISIFLCCLSSGFASDDGGTESPFSLGAGARDLALGGAAIATSEPTTAPFWNPSRLARVERFSFSGFHSRLYESDVSYQYFGLVWPTLDFGVLALGVFRLGVDGIEIRDEYNFQQGETDDNRLGFYLAYGRSLYDYDVGFALTMEHHSLDDYSTTSSPGLNLSVSRRFTLSPAWLESLTLALTGGNIIRMGATLADETYKYPTSFDGGFTLDLSPGKQWLKETAISGKLSKTNHADMNYALGLELRPIDLIDLRCGLNDDHLSFGAGLSCRLLDFDYALIDRDMGDLHMFTLTLAFGQKTSEKKLIRYQRRETEFNDKMSRELQTRNNTMVDSLVNVGGEKLADGDLTAASSLFDRALFIARSSGVDTVHIKQLADDTDMRLRTVSRKMRYGEFMDSVDVKFDAGDYLSAKYFAGLALSEEPNSSDAASLMAKADSIIESSLARDETIQKQLWMIDSLLSFGQIQRAGTVVRSLEKFAPDNSGVIMAVRRVEFERWREIASIAYDNKDFETALEALDSVSVLFPGHQWSTELKERIRTELNSEQGYATEITPDKPVPLSKEIQKEVKTIYEAAQKAFEKGNLTEAIISWEKVERLAPNYQSVREYLVNAYKFVGVELYGQNRLKEAVDNWKKAAELDPANTEIKNYINRTENEILKLKELTYEE